MPLLYSKNLGNIFQFLLCIIQEHYVFRSNLKGVYRNLAKSITDHIRRKINPIQYQCVLKNVYICIVAFYHISYVIYYSTSICINDLFPEFKEPAIVSSYTSKLEEEDASTKIILIPLADSKSIVSTRRKRLAVPFTRVSWQKKTGANDRDKLTHFLRARLLLLQSLFYFKRISCSSFLLYFRSIAIDFFGVKLTCLWIVDVLNYKAWFNI